MIFLLNLMKVVKHLISELNDTCLKLSYHLLATFRKILLPNLCLQFGSCEFLGNAKKFYESIKNLDYGTATKRNCLKYFCEI